MADDKEGHMEEELQQQADMYEDWAIGILDAALRSSKPDEVSCSLRTVDSSSLIVV